LSSFELPLYERKIEMQKTQYFSTPMGPILGPIVPTTSTLIENFLDKEDKSSST
jgi:hypothetical protein